MSRIVHRDAYYVFHFQNILPDAIVITFGMDFSDKSTLLSYESDIATPINIVVERLEQRHFSMLFPSGNRTGRPELHL
jgi:hypothetical protein